MSEPFSGRAQSSMDIALHRPRPAIPFIKDVDINDVVVKSEIKTEIKAEPTGRSSPLFEPQSSMKRSMNDEISVSEVKKSRVATENTPRAYGGGPVQDYVPGKEYKYTRHEAVPELEMNGHHHLNALDNFLFNMREVVLPALSPFRDEDKSVNDSVEWFEKSANIPAISPTRFALSGNSGSGKTSTLNNVLGHSGLANADAAMESVTQNPQIFNHGSQEVLKDAMFLVEILFLNGRAIENLVKRCLTDLVHYYKYIRGGEDENEYIRESAESRKQVMDDLFSHQEGLKSLDEVEDFLENRHLLSEDKEDMSESAVQCLYEQIRERAFSDGINLDKRELRLTAGNVGELHAKIIRFAERGAFAPLVSSIRTFFYSPLLSMGIEIADLPGYTDTNIHLRKTSMAYSVNCPKAIFVADISRCLTTPELKKNLKDLIKHKGAENVCLVLRGKEIVEKSRSKWTKDESAYLDTLERSLKAAKAQLDNNNESVTAQATLDVENIERQILEYRISVRDRVIIDHFSQKEYQNKHNTSKIRVITVANKCHEQYMLGTNKAILSIDKTGIKDLQAFMCETPSKDRVRAFARHSANCIMKMRRITIWADGPKMPPRDAAMALFEQHTRWGVDSYKVSLVKALTHYKKLLITRFNSKWTVEAQTVMDGWTTYAPVSQGVFIRQGGRHSPQIKGIKTKKPKLVSWVEGLLTIVEDDVLSLLKSTWDAINEVEGRIFENIFDVVEKICHGLEMLDTIGGSNLEGVFEIFKEEGKACAGDVKDGIIELRTNLRSKAMASVADEPCDQDSPAFIKEMSKIFTATWNKFPPKTKNACKERMKYIREQVTSGKGPYTVMCHEIVIVRMAPVINEWAEKTDARIERLHGDLRDVLFKSFEGKQTSDARREEIAPAIKLAMTQARAVLQADLDGYSADIL